MNSRSLSKEIEVLELALREYKRKRNFSQTPEPAPIVSGKRPAKPMSLRFVIQKHDASRLHYDFRLETKDGVLKSWAVPRGLSLDPLVKRLAVMTEDHPGDYIDFEGEIPQGNYGAGNVIVWDTGRYETVGDVDDQVKSGKIAFTLFGEKVKGSFFLVKTKQGDGKHWLLIKSRDEHVSGEDLAKTLPHSVLSGRTIQSKSIKHERVVRSVDVKGTPAAFPTAVKPMLALPVDKPFDKKDWVFEVKWDGVRAMLFLEKSKSILELHSRKGTDITARYPEIVSSVQSGLKCRNSAVLDGEVVVLDDKGIPDFQRHQKRMNVDNARELALLSKSIPATYYVFDILYLDGLSLEELDFVTRRETLSKIVSEETPAIRISEYIEEQGKAVFRNALRMNLEGIVAKYKFSKYLQGARPSAWLKIKGVLTQDCVVIGYTEGEGNRKGLFGSLILAAYRNGKLEFVGHSGSGFGFEQLKLTLDRMQRLITDSCPIEHVPYVNRHPVWLRPELVVEVKFQSWTQDVIMRAPIFLRFREDKRPEECIIETPGEARAVVDNASTSSDGEAVGSARKRKQVFTNLNKVFWNATSDHRALTKGDLVEYYDKISGFLLPHLRDRPLSLNRYPDGIRGKSFFHKNWHQNQPVFVQSIRVFSESSQRIINYILCNNKETLVWLANLGCIEMHPWYSHVNDFDACMAFSKTSDGGNGSSLDELKCGLDTPDFAVFDLDPYIYSGRELKGEEPEYNVRGFNAAVHVALELKDLLDSWKLQSFVKTSGKTGLHVFVPLDPLYSFEQTRMFAELFGRILLDKSATKGKITMEWSTARRKGKVFFDYNQNAKGKTVASVFSARPTKSATVSMPIEWRRIEDVKPTDFTVLNVPEILKKSGDPWRHIMKTRQDLHSILEDVSEANI